MEPKDWMQLGGVGIAGLSLFWAWRKNRADHLRDRRTEAYGQFLEGVCTASAPGVLRGSELHTRASAQHMTGRAKILLYGSPEVIRNLARFYEAGAAFDTAKQRASFGELVKAMRADGTKTDLTLNQVSYILLDGSELDGEGKKSLPHSVI